MDSIIQKLEALPPRGIEITADAGTDAVPYFKNLKITLMTSKVVKIEPKSFRKVLAEIKIRFNPNSSNSAGFILLIAAARQLEEMNDFEGDLMFTALSRVVELATAAITVSTQPSPLNRRCRLISPSATLPTASFPSFTISISSNSANPLPPASVLIEKKSSKKRAFLKRPRAVPDSEEDDVEIIPKKFKDDGATLFLPAIIAKAILASKKKRATLSEIRTYMKNTLEEELKLIGNWEHKLAHLLDRRPCFQKMNIGPFGTRKVGCYYKIVKGSFDSPTDSPSRGPRHFKRSTDFTLTMPATWLNLLSAAFDSTSTGRKTREELSKYLIEHYEYFDVLGLVKVMSLVNSQLSNLCRKGEGAYRNHGGNLVYYYHLKSAIQGTASNSPEESSDIEIDETIRPSQTWKQLVEAAMLSSKKIRMTREEVCEAIKEKYKFYFNLETVLLEGVRRVLTQDSLFIKSGVSGKSGNRTQYFWALVGNEQEVEEEGEQEEEDEFDDDITSGSLNVLNSVIQASPSRLLNRPSFSLSIPDPSQSSFRPTKNHSTSSQHQSGIKEKKLEKKIKLEIGNQEMKIPSSGKTIKSTVVYREEKMKKEIVKKAKVEN